MFSTQRIMPAVGKWRRECLAGLSCLWNGRFPTHSVKQTYALHSAWHCVLPLGVAKSHWNNDADLQEPYQVAMYQRAARHLHRSRINCSEVRCQMPAFSNLMDTSDEDTRSIMEKDLLICQDFITHEEEKFLYEEVEPYLKRLRYEYDHWDDAIHGYRETEKQNWSEKSNAVLQRVRDLAFPSDAAQMAFVHVLDLAKNGYIKPHIDSVRFCGSTIAGICLLSDSIMRLVHDKNKSSWADILLSKRSLYVMKGRARYEYTHEILGETESQFCGNPVPRERRISVICRCEPETDISGQNT